VLTLAPDPNRVAIRSGSGRISQHHLDELDRGELIAFQAPQDVLDRRRH
jgi:hypothetical protein